MLTASEVAALLNVSPGWVYRHKNALGGFQPTPGAAVRFSENRIVEIKEGKHAIPNAEREMARETNDRWGSENKGIPHKARSKKMGGGARGLNVGREKLHDPHSLLA